MEAVLKKIGIFVPREDRIVNSLIEDSQLTINTAEITKPPTVDPPEIKRMKRKRKKGKN